MKQLRVLVGRNLAIFIKNRTNVLLCIFSVGIVMGLYVIFLRDFIIQSVTATGFTMRYVKEFTDRMMLSGLLIVLNTTTSFGIMQLSVADAASGVQRDFLVAPVSRFQLVVGYWVTSMIVSFVFTTVTFGGSEIYFILAYGNRVESAVTLECIGTIAFASCMNAGLLLCVMKFMKDTTSFSTFGNLYGMLCGFLAGTYLPYAMYPQRLRNVLFYFPPMQLTSMMRQINLSVFTNGDELIGEFLYQSYGITLMKGGEIITMKEQWSILLFALVIVLLIIRVEYRET